MPGLGREEQEPFIDCSVGGEELEEGEIQVMYVYLLREASLKLSFLVHLPLFSFMFLPFFLNFNFPLIVL